MIETLNAREWERVRGYVAKFTADHIRRKHGDRLRNELARIAKARPPFKAGQPLSASLVEQALKWCKPAATLDEADA